MAWQFVIDSAIQGLTETQLESINKKYVEKLLDRGESLEIRVVQDGEKFQYLKGSKAIQMLRTSPEKCQFLARDGIDIPPPPMPDNY